MCKTKPNTKKESKYAPIGNPEAKSNNKPPTIAINKKFKLFSSKAKIIKSSNNKLGASPKKAK
jgi:hypothetical protein